jgi:hypothetical protein
MVQAVRGVNEVNDDSYTSKVFHHTQGAGGPTSPAVHEHSDFSFLRHGVNKRWQKPERDAARNLVKQKHEVF